MKFLIANDEPFILLSMKQIFESNPNNEVVQAMNGDEAVKIIQRNMIEFHQYDSDNKSHTKPKHFDAIILDLEMPIMGGYVAC